MAHWQTIISALIVVAACVYIGRRLYSQLRSLVNPTSEVKLPCASGCDKCGGAQPPQKRST